MYVKLRRFHRFNLEGYMFSFYLVLVQPFYNISECLLNDKCHH